MGFEQGIHHGKFERYLSVVLGIGIVTLLIFQFSSLYVAPVHDSHLWWGDESWLMNEYREQMTSGVFRLPAAEASTVQVGNPFPFTAMWITSVLYGGASQLFPNENLIDVGRSVSAMASLALLIVMLWQARKVSILGVLTAIALLVGCRSFLLASHCSRYDILSSLWVLFVMINLDRSDKLSTSHLVLLSFSIGAGLMISVHVPVILALPVAYCALRTVREPLRLTALVIPAVLMVGALYLVHLLTQPALSAAHDITYSVGDQPILHLFSKVIQRGNLNHKFGLLSDFAAPVFFMLAVSLLGVLLGSKSQRNRIVLWILPVVGWYFLESGPVSYLIYMLPCLAIASALAIERFIPSLRIGVAVCSLIAVTFAINDAINARSLGSQLAHELSTAITQADSVLGTYPVVSMNPALSQLQADPKRVKHGVYTTHFVLLPLISSPSKPTPASLLLFDRASYTNFTWESEILRSEITEPSFVRTGRFLDAARSYFEPIDSSLDTLLIQRIDLNEFYQHYRR